MFAYYLTRIRRLSFPHTKQSTHMLPIDYEVILLIQIAAFYKVHPINKYGTSLPDKLLALILFVNCKDR